MLSSPVHQLNLEALNWDYDKNGNRITKPKRKMIETPVPVPVAPPQALNLLP